MKKAQGFTLAIAVSPTAEAASSSTNLALQILDEALRHYLSP